MASRTRSPGTPRQGDSSGRRGGGDLPGNDVDREYERMSRLYVGLGTVLKTLKEKRKIPIARDLATHVLEAIDTDNLSDNIDIIGPIQPMYRRMDDFHMVQSLVSSFLSTEDMTEDEMRLLDRCVHVFKYKEIPVIYLWDLIKSIRGLNTELDEKNNIFNQLKHELSVANSVTNNEADRTAITAVFETVVDEGINSDQLDANCVTLNQMSIRMDEVRTRKSEGPTIDHTERTNVFYVTMETIRHSWNLEEDERCNRAELLHSVLDLCDSFKKRLEIRLSEPGPDLFSFEELHSIDDAIGTIRSVYELKKFNTQFVSQSLDTNTLIRNCSYIETIAKVIDFQEHDLPLTIKDTITPYVTKINIEEAEEGSRYSFGTVYDIFLHVCRNNTRRIDLVDSPDQENVLRLRYHGKEIQEFKAHCPRYFMRKLSSSMGSQMSKSVMICGLATLVRMNSSRFRPRSLDICKLLISSFGLELSEFEKSDAARSEMSVDNVAQTVAYKRHIQNEFKKAVIQMAGNCSIASGVDARMLSEIDSTFEALNNPSDNGCECFHKLCCIDLFFAEKIFIHGLVVIFHKLFSSLQDPNSYRSLISTEVNMELMNANLARFNILTTNHLRENYMDLFSIFHNATKPEFSRVNNRHIIKFSTITEYTDLIKTETLIMAFILFHPTEMTERVIGVISKLPYTQGQISRLGDAINVYRDPALHGMMQLGGLLSSRFPRENGQPGRRSITCELKGLQSPPHSRLTLLSALDRLVDRLSLVLI
jgi:hypothetical protein